MINLYTMDLNDEAHEPILDNLVRRVVYLDSGSSEEYKAALDSLEILKELNEEKVYNSIIDDLKNDSRYQEFFSKT